MKCLLDMNLSPKWVGFLEGAGVEAVHWSNVGRADAPDREVMHWAAEHNHLVMTCDLDFGAILAAGGESRPSVLLIRSEDLDPQRIGDLVLAALRQTERELAVGAIVSIDSGRLRLRILPLRGGD